MSRLRCLLLLVPWLLMSGAEARGSESVTTRIVSLVPSATEILFALGARNQVVGVSDFCKYPPEAAALPRAGGLLNPSIEQIVLMRPTLVVLYRAQTDVAAKLARLGIAAETVSCDTTSEVVALLRVAGGWTGLGAEAERLAGDLLGGLDVIASASLNRRRPSVLLVISRDATDLASIYAASANSYHGELLERAGGDNVLGSLPVPTIPLSKEELIRLNPEVIIDMSLGEQAGAGRQSAAHEAVWGQLSAVRAVQNKRVYFLANPHFLVPGLAATETAMALNRLLHPKPAAAGMPPP
jgi:iron complex transport system substrate-binding protein